MVGINFSSPPPRVLKKKRHAGQFIESMNPEIDPPALFVSPHGTHLYPPVLRRVDVAGGDGLRRAAPEVSGVRRARRVRPTVPRVLPAPVGTLGAA